MLHHIVNILKFDTEVTSSLNNKRNKRIDQSK
jgi:hypothetical protein